MMFNSSSIRREDFINHSEDNSVCNLQTLELIRSVVDELYQINSQDNFQFKQKRVRFTFEQQTKESKVDCGVSTKDFVSLQYECATQTSEEYRSLQIDLHPLRSNITLSTIESSLKNTFQFDQILVNRYHLSTTQANLFVKVMDQWWKKHKLEFTNTFFKSPGIEKDYFYRK
ncbi:hypothetical protein I4U23_026492 [Adineta vaga]|nr:hypothetical protein I4U23_026492 [Adineta vaga]